MARSSVREELRQRMRDHLAVAELHPPEEASLDVRNVASVLRVSPTTLYKYGFNREINAAEQRQRTRNPAANRGMRTGLERPPRLCQRFKAGSGS